MALLDSEISRLKYELGFPGMSTGAEPYIGIVAAFDQVVKPYLLSGAITTSSTEVVAASPATPTDITLASATGVSVGDRLVVDVDNRQESAIVSALSGAVATVSLSLDHSGTYPVTVEGTESIVRQRLRTLVDIGTRLERALGRAGIKKVDEIEFFASESGGGTTVFSDLIAQREYHRGELSRAIFGVGGLNGHYAGSAGSGGGSRLSVY